MAQVATYKGRKYKLAWQGQTKHGERAKLQFWDGSKEFWVDAALIQVSESAPSYKRSRYGSGAGSAANVSGYSSYCTDRPGCQCFDCAD